MAHNQLGPQALVSSASPDTGSRAHRGHTAVAVRSWPRLLQEWHFGMWILGLIGGNRATCRHGWVSPSCWLSGRAAKCHGQLWSPVLGSGANCAQTSSPPAPAPGAGCNGLQVCHRSSETMTACMLPSCGEGRGHRVEVMRNVAHSKCSGTFLILR